MRRLTADEFLAWYSGQPVKHEFVRGENFAAYRQLPSLAEFLLVDIDARRCKLFRKGADGQWVLHLTQSSAGRCTWPA